jgi:hypothetical protein
MRYTIQLVSGYTAYYCYDYSSCITGLDTLQEMGSLLRREYMYSTLEQTISKVLKHRQWKFDLKFRLTWPDLVLSIFPDAFASTIIWNNQSTEKSMQIVVFIECNQTIRCTIYSEAGHRSFSTTNHLFVTFFDDDILIFFCKTNKYSLIHVYIIILSVCSKPAALLQNVTITEYWRILVFTVSLSYFLVWKDTN